jgi:hypothetical protein
MGCGCNGMGFSGNGMGAYFKDKDSVTHSPHGNRAGTVSRAGRVVGMDRLGRAIATDGFGAYYLAVPGQMFSGFGDSGPTGYCPPGYYKRADGHCVQGPTGYCPPGYYKRADGHCVQGPTASKQIFSGFGAAQAFAFDSAAVWSDWVASKCTNPDDYKNNQAMCTIRGKRAVDSIRAALGNLGYGTSEMSVMWTSADQANYKQWAADSGQSSSSGMPEKGHLQLMEQQISQGMKPGPEAAVSYAVVGGEIVDAGAALLQKAKGLGWKFWALIGASAIVGVVIYKKRKAGKQYTSYKKTTAIEPYRGGQMQPAYAANPGHHWPKQSKEKFVNKLMRGGRSRAQAEAFYRVYRGQQSRKTRRNGRKY